jgi:hypothetical protein
MTQQEALKKIHELSRPGQTVQLRDAIDILTDIWNVSKEALKEIHNEQ